MTDSIHAHLAPGPARAGVLAERVGVDRDRTEMVALEPGATWSVGAGGEDLQLLVAEGACMVDGTAMAAGGYGRWADGSSVELSSSEGCMLLLKRRPARELEPHEAPRVLVDPGQASWAPGHGGLRVLHLDARDTESTALVLWPAEERFIPHRHLGGEEIFVLRGTFIDEHGRYPAGTWIQSAHGSTHHPYVEDETLIWVKTGHLAP